LFTLKIANAIDLIATQVAAGEHHLNDTVFTIKHPAPSRVKIRPKKDKHTKEIATGMVFIDNITAALS
jgi:hypothetical protein